MAILIIEDFTDEYEVEVSDATRNSDTICTLFQEVLIFIYTTDCWFY
ncbi:MAG TPA: hypothetical protein VLJ41_15415 [Segetibacter sp.]|nr:hypothetical protein [Segetibacter sp.]